MEVAPICCSFGESRECCDTLDYAVKILFVIVSYWRLYDSSGPWCYCASLGLLGGPVWARLGLFWVVLGQA
eukprot:6569198-Pyramimonas_sp.AAC.1